MKQTYHFISGLPRAGGNLLANILTQNPRFHTGRTSGLIDIVVTLRNRWDASAQFKASPDEDAKLRVLRGVLPAYYNVTDKPVVFDQSPAWLTYLELAETVLGRPPKVLVPVRDLRDILASFEMLWRQTIKTTELSIQTQFYKEFRTLLGRCETFLRGDQPLGATIAAISDAILRGHRAKLHFVHHEQLTSQPEKVMRGVYGFLGEEYFKHDFAAVPDAVREPVMVYGFREESAHRPRLEPSRPRYAAVLGSELSDAFKGPYPWS